VGTALYQWLVEAEESLMRMIRGVFRFMEEFPSCVYRFIVETAAPVAIRTCRVLGLACLWLMLLFGPIVVACACGFGGFWTLASLAWAVVAIIGSVWGLNRAVKKRKTWGGPASAR
jgi:hypothetical protein